MESEIHTTIRGEKVSYEKIAGFDEICIGCPYNNMGNCLVWKYITPAICKEIREEINSVPLSYYVSKPITEVRIYKILIYWDWKTKTKEYDYRKVKSIIDCNGYRILGVRDATEGEYYAFCKKEEEELKKHTLRKFIPPVNPWIGKRNAT